MGSRDLLYKIVYNMIYQEDHLNNDVMSGPNARESCLRDTVCPTSLHYWI